MSNTETVQRPGFPKGLLHLFGFTEAGDMPQVQRRAYRLFAELIAPLFGPELLVGALRPQPEDRSQIQEVYEHNIALAYLETMRRGRTPTATCPSRDDSRPAEPREVLAELFIAVVDRDRATYTRALVELVALAQRGDVLTEEDLERPR